MCGDAGEAIARTPRDGLRDHATAGSVSVLERPRASVVSNGQENPDDLFALGVGLEERDNEAAQAAYRWAMHVAPSRPDACLNLGAMLCEEGRCEEGVVLYEQAVAQCPDGPLLHFNRAIVLDDCGRIKESLASYEMCLRLAPDMADAHYNLASVHEQMGDKQKALRHLNAYRMLQRGTR